MNFNEAKNKKYELDLKCSEASKKLNEFNTMGKTSLGLTPDHVKELPEYKMAKQEFDRCFKELRAFNSVYTKTFKKELSLERKQKVK